MKTLFTILMYCIFFGAYPQSLSLDEFKKEKIKELKTESTRESKDALTMPEKAKARELYSLYNIETPCSPADSLKRTSSWIKQKLDINHDQFLRYLNFMGGVPRKEDIK